MRKEIKEDDMARTGSVYFDANAMINLKVIRDNQRLAVLRGGRDCRLVGPGVIFVMKWPGRRYFLISMGDRGQLVTQDEAQFGDTRLPVGLRGSPASTAVRVVDFQDNVIVVVPEDAGSPNVASNPVPERKTVAVRYTPPAFWIGLPLVLFLAVASWMGVRYAADQIHTERAVYEHGVLTTGTVVRKILYHQTKNGEQTHYITYAFQTPAGTTIRKEEIRIDPDVWNGLRENGPIAIRYVPDKPELNLPDGWHMTSFFYLVGGIALAGALLFSVVTVGVLVKKLSGGYRGETHMFLGKRPPGKR
jgi:hypothetical protein